MARTKPTALKKDGTYKDAPRYQAIYGYEDDFKKNFSNTLKLSINQISKKLNEFSKS